MRKNNKKGFTLVELLLVLLLMVLMSALVGPILIFGINTFTSSMRFRSQMDRINRAIMMVRMDVEASSKVYELKIPGSDPEGTTLDNMIVFEIHEYVKAGDGSIETDQYGGADYNKVYKYWKFDDEDNEGELWGELKVAKSYDSPEELGTAEIDALDYDVIIEGLNRDVSMFVVTKYGQNEIGKDIYNLLVAFMPEEKETMNDTARSLNFPVIMEYSLRNKNTKLQLLN